MSAARRVVEMRCGGCGATFPSNTSHRCESIADGYDRRLRAEGASAERARVLGIIDLRLPRLPGYDLAAKRALRDLRAEIERGGE